MFELIKNRRAAWLVLVLSLGALSSTQSSAKDDDDEKEARLPRMSMEQQDAGLALLKESKFSKDGADTCVGCHDAENAYPIFPLFKTKHGVKADQRSPFGADNKQCESCHGAGNTHAKAKKKDKRSGNIINFGKNAWTPVKDQNDKCLACHSTHQRLEWKGSSHEFNGVACASCHKIHVAKDPILDRREQSRTCLECHANKQAKFFQASHHPVREGKMACTECHDIHGDNASGLMVKANTRQMCVKCHAEKRGPFLWEHAPAAEDCMLCHDPHGSNQPALLKKRPPQLCQECHSPSGHPSLSADGSRWNAGSMFLGAKGCMNCHTAVHGSNHPSGVTQLR